MNLISNIITIFIIFSYKCAQHFTKVYQIIFCQTNFWMPLLLPPIVSELYISSSQVLIFIIYEIFMCCQVFCQKLYIANHFSCSWSFVQDTCLRSHPTFFPVPNTNFHEQLRQYFHLKFQSVGLWHVVGSHRPDGRGTLSMSASRGVV